MNARFLVLIFALPGAAGAAQGDDLPQETYKAKALMLRRFAESFKWPENTFPKETSPFRIGVLGEDPFKKFLDDLKDELTVKKHPIELKRESDPTKLLDCHLVFIARSEKESLEEHLKVFAGKPILLMGDTPGFGKRGVGLNLLMKLKDGFYETKYGYNKETVGKAGLELTDSKVKLTDPN